MHHGGALSPGLSLPTPPSEFIGTRRSISVTCPSIELVIMISSEKELYVVGVKSGIVPAAPAPLREGPACALVCENKGTAGLLSVCFVVDPGNASPIPFVIGGGVCAGVGTAVASLDGSTDSPSASRSAPMSSNKGSYGDGGSMSTSWLAGGVGCLVSSVAGGMVGLLAPSTAGIASIPTAFDCVGGDEVVWPFVVISGVRSLTKKSAPTFTETSIPFVCLGSGGAARSPVGRRARDEI